MTLRKGEIELLSHKSLTRVALSLAALVILTAGIANAQPGICLNRTPAPPAAVRNDGTGTVTFNWTIDKNTTCTQVYQLDIINPGGSVILTQTFPCTPLTGSYVYHVPAGLPCGCYYGRLTFFSDWCAGSSGKFEDQAWVGFTVSAGATFRICKRWDLNGDGIVTSDPPLSGWSFTVERPVGTVIAMGTTSTDGCTTVNIDVECTGTTQVWIRETIPPGWVKTTPQGALNPFPINVAPGTNPDVLVGNWQPVFITGYKLLDQAPWPWTSPQYVGPQGQQNPPEWEPTPPCVQPTPPACLNPFQPDQLGIPNTYVCLYDDTVDPPVKLACTRTLADGSFSFGPLQYRQNFRIVVPPVDDQGQPNPAPVPPSCATNSTDYGLPAWTGAYYPTVASSSWPSPVLPCPNMDFVNPDLLRIVIPAPTVANQTYGCNHFFNNQPSRLWGVFCQQTVSTQPSLTLGVHKDGDVYPVPSVSADVNGRYVVPPVTQQQPGLQPGTFTLTLPAPSDTNTEQWQATTYCDSIHGNSTFMVPNDNLNVQVGVPHSTDVRVDFCLISTENNRRCFLPVTFTQDGWHFFCDPNNGIINGGMIYNKFPIAFGNFTYFGTPYQNKVIIGQGKTVTFDGTTSNLTRLCSFFPQTAQCGKLVTNYVNPVSTSAGSLAGELLALQMNIAYNDMRLMPRTYGYDLEKFTLAKGLYKGKTVREVRNIANAVLGGAPPCSYGLTDCQALVDILAAINANYEFVNYNVFNDRGYLIPNRTLGPADPPVPPVVP
jgi:hypothetical protein